MIGGSLPFNRSAKQKVEQNKPSQNPAKINVKNIQGKPKLVSQSMAKDWSPNLLFTKLKQAEITAAVKPTLSNTQHSTIKQKTKTGLNQN